jgi:iron(III) transport system substrate-binding protein
LPVLDQVSRYLGPGRDAQTRAEAGEVRADLSARRHHIRQFALAGRSVDLILSGKITTRGLLDLSVVATSGPDVLSPVSFSVAGIPLSSLATAALPVGQIATLSRFLSNRTIVLSVTGTTRSPQVRLEPLATLQEAVVRYFLNAAQARGAGDRRAGGRRRTRRHGGSVKKTPAGGQRRSTHEPSPLPRRPARAGRCSKPKSSRVVVYCAQDREFAEELFAGYQQALGVEVAARYDSEAAKSVGLAEDLVREKDRPRCDLWWNNEPLQTIRLARLGLLAPLPRNTLPAAFPDWASDTERRYQGFAARARVVVTHTPSAKTPVTSIFDLLRPEYRGRAAIASRCSARRRPQAACLADVLGLGGGAALLCRPQGERGRGPGGQQAGRRGGGGWPVRPRPDRHRRRADRTQAGPAVGIVFPDREPHAEHPRLGTLYLPNTIAWSATGRTPTRPPSWPATCSRRRSRRGWRRPAATRSRCAPGVKATLPPEIVTPDRGRPMRVDFARAAGHAEAVQSFLRELFA